MSRSDSQHCSLQDQGTSVPCSTQKVGWASVAGPQLGHQCACSQKGYAHVIVALPRLRLFEAAGPLCARPESTHGARRACRWLRELNLSLPLPTRGQLACPPDQIRTSPAHNSHEDHHPLSTTSSPEPSRASAAAPPRAASSPAPRRGGPAPTSSQASLHVPRDACRLCPAPRPPEAPSHSLRKRHRGGRGGRG